MLYNHIGLE